MGLRSSQYLFHHLPVQNPPKLGLKLGVILQLSIRHHGYLEEECFFDSRNAAGDGKLIASWFSKFIGFFEGYGKQSMENTFLEKTQIVKMADN